MVPLSYTTCEVRPPTVHGSWAAHTISGNKPHLFRAFSACTYVDSGPETTPTRDNKYKNQ
jgi:hypothetical protein